jgi:hypothetical protein
MRQGPQREDWAAGIARLLEGDPLACLQISRLVTGFLFPPLTWRKRGQPPALGEEIE